MYVDRTAVLVSSEALRLGVGTTSDLAGLGRRGFVVRGVLWRNLCYWPSQQPDRPCAVGNWDDPGISLHLLAEGRATAMALG